jgi:hypothetical protein
MKMNTGMDMYTDTEHGHGHMYIGVQCYTVRLTLNWLRHCIPL